MQRGPIQIQPRSRKSPLIRSSAARRTTRFFPPPKKKKNAKQDQISMHHWGWGGGAGVGSSTLFGLKSGPSSLLVVCVTLPDSLKHRCVWHTRGTLWGSQFWMLDILLQIRTSKMCIIVKNTGWTAGHYISTLTTKLLALRRQSTG